MTEHTNPEFEQEFYGENELRWYQIAARNQTIEHMKNGIKRVLVVLPTGTGKTITLACSLSDPSLKQALGVPSDRPLRVLFTSHVRRLLTQAERTFVEDSNVEVIMQSIFSDIPEDVIKKGWDITVLDEAHHESCMTFQYQLEQLGDHPIVGLTATPDRADGCLIKFEEIVNPISREQAVAEGYLAPTYLHSIVDTAARNKVSIAKMIVDEFGSQFGQTMMFFRSKAEVREMTEYLVEKGYSAIAILNQSSKELDRILDQFSEKKYQFLLNCNKINEGVDVRGCTDVFLGRSYGSYPQLNQVIGRASRPDSDCNVWELVNPLSGRNLDTTVVVGTPERHRLISRKRGQWVEQDFDYVSKHETFEGKAYSVDFGGW